MHNVLEQLKEEKIDQIPEELAAQAIWGIYKQIEGKKDGKQLKIRALNYKDTVDQVSLKGLEALDHDKAIHNIVHKKFHGLAAYNAEDKEWILLQVHDRHIQAIERRERSDAAKKAQAEAQAQAKADADAKAQAEADAKKQAEVQAYREEKAAEVQAELNSILSSVSALNSKAEEEIGNECLLRREEILEQVDAIAEDVNSSEFFDKKAFEADAMHNKLTDQNSGCGFKFLVIPQEGQVRYLNNGVYISNHTGVIEAAVDRLLKAKSDPAHISKTIALIKVRHSFGYEGSSEFPALHPEWINLANGMWNIQHKKLFAHEDFYAHDQLGQIKSVIQLPIAYYENANNDEFERYLLSKLPSAEEVEFVFKAMGYSMMQLLPYKRFFIYQGKSNTGKSTALKVLKAMLGSNNISATELHKIDSHSGRFGLSKLYGKLANIIEESSAYHLDGSGALKAAVDGAEQNIEEKYIATYMAKLFATIFAATNKPVLSRDKGDGFTDRLTIIPFHKKHEKDPNVEKNLLRREVLEGALRRSLFALTDLIAEGGFADTQAMRDAKEDNLIAEDLEFRFAIEFLDQDVNIQHGNKVQPSRIPCGDLHKLYLKWIRMLKDQDKDLKDVKPLKDQSFNDKIEEWCGIKRAKGTIWGVDCGQQLCMDGIALSEEGEAIMQKLNIKDIRGSKQKRVEE